MASIVTMFGIGLALQGRIYRPNGRRHSRHAGFVGDVGAGALYIVTRAMDWGQGAIAHATADYGTKYLIVAGLLNFIAVLTPITSPSGRNHNADFPLHRRRPVFGFRLGGLRDHPAQHPARDDALRPVLLRMFVGGVVRGG